MQSLAQKHILLGVCGGVAAYKCADLVRRLREIGAEVRVVMTRGAQELFTPLLFQAVSGNPVHTALFDETTGDGMRHIELARWADAIVIAPASANHIALLANGLANDLLSTLCLASEAPLFIAPAMNQTMWQHAAVQDNIVVLRARGAMIVGPADGDQACGDRGAGRLLEPLQLRTALVDHFLPQSPVLHGLRVLLTAGPTRETLDPVRFISNHSSGKMGFALAAAAQQAGAAVTLVAGPVNQTTPQQVVRINVVNAQEMYASVLEHSAAADIFISVAAVADYRTQWPREHKIKKSSPSLTITLRRNPDILAAVAAIPDGPFTVGFAAETENVEQYAMQKMQEKKIDMIAANHIGAANSGFDSDCNQLIVLSRDGTKECLPHARKTELARQIVALIAARRNALCK